MTGDIRMDEWFAHPRDRVYRAWVTSDGIAAWFGVPPWSVSAVHFPLREGERWWVDFARPQGDAYREEGVIGVVRPPDQLAFTLQQRGMGDPAPMTSITVTFEERDGGTRVLFVQTGFDDDSHRNQNAEGWRACFDVLRRSLAHSPGS